MIGGTDLNSNLPVSIRGYKTGSMLLIRFGLVSVVSKLYRVHTF